MVFLSETRMMGGQDVVFLKPEWKWYGSGQDEVFVSKSRRSGGSRCNVSKQERKVRGSRCSVSKQEWKVRGVKM